MKAVMLSIQPKWIELIANGKKTVEVRKTKPKIDVPFKCYIYCTEKDYDKIFCVDKFMHKVFLNGDGKQKVIGEFVCDEIFPIRVFENGSIQDYVRHSMERSCVPYDDISAYIGKDKTGYGWHITDLVIYDTPKELSEFKQIKIIRGYHKEGETKIEKLLKGSRIEVKYLTRPPQSWCYVEELKGES